MKASFHGAKINPVRFHRSQVKFYLILVPIAIFMLLPVMFIVSEAFKPLDELFRFPPTFIVERPTLDNFRHINEMMGATGLPVSRFLINSLIVTVSTVVLTLLITGMTAYVFSKKKFKLNKLLFRLNQAALMFVATAVVMPRYMIIMNIGLNNNFLANIIPLLAMPVGLFLVKQFVDTNVPDELIEAAKIDGAGELKILFGVVFPLIKPALATVCILTFQTVWGSVEGSAMFIEDDTLRTFPFLLHTFSTAATTEVGGNPIFQGVNAAAGLIMFFPNLIIFIAMQSRVMNTMSHSGIK